MALSNGISIFAIMVQMCRDNNAINLSQGCPDFDCDPRLVELHTAAMQNGHNQYAPMEGILKLREGISAKCQNLYQAYYDPATEITITSGATEAIYSCITSVVSRGDEVIIFEPAFDSYVPVVKLAGGIPVSIALSYPDYKIDWDIVQSKITGKTKLIIINSPHNPTGSVLEKQDFQKLADITRDKDILILSDEVYEHIIFEDKQHESIALHPELRSRSFIIASFGKTFHTTGWRMGYCIAPAMLTNGFRKVHQYVTFCATSPAQHAIAEYMNNPSSYLSLPLFYQQKRDLFLELMKESRFNFIPSKGTYFQLMAYDAISKEDDLNFSRWLVESLKVASIPLSPFYSDAYSGKVIRFCFAKKEETLIRAAEKLCAI